jgi:uncharacterized lipoprotein YbaY
MRTISGDIALPDNCPSVGGVSVLIEVRDVSRIDTPSRVVAQTRLTETDICPGAHLAFSLPVPEVHEAVRLEFRIHVSVGNSEYVRSGDLLTTASHPVPSRGSTERLTIPVVLI